MVTDRPAQCMFCEKREEAYAVARKIVTEQQLQIASLRAALRAFINMMMNPNYDAGEVLSEFFNIARAALDGTEAKRMERRDND